MKITKIRGDANQSKKKKEKEKKKKKYLLK